MINPRGSYHLPPSLLCFASSIFAAALLPTTTDAVHEMFRSFALAAMLAGAAAKNGNMNGEYAVTSGGDVDTNWY